MTLYRRFLAYARPYWGLALAASVCFVVSGFLGAYPIQLFKRAGDMAVGDTAPLTQRDTIDTFYWLGLSYIGLRIALGGVHFLEAYLSKKLIQNVVFDLRSDLYAHLQTLSLCVFEADLPMWRAAFQDVGTLVTLMDRYDVRYRHKFSGHRSLHIVIPGDIVPPEYRGKATRKLSSHLLKWSGSQAHHLPKITRMPYSLNEDTGLVCLPIERGTLARFRPWQANVHQVEIQTEAWYESSTSEDTEAVQAFVAALDDLDAGSVSPKQAFFVPDLEGIKAHQTPRRMALKKDNPLGHVWTWLMGKERLTNTILTEVLAYTDPDARGLALEAYLLHGTQLTEPHFAQLLAQEEEYTQVSAADIMLRFEDEVFPHLLRLVKELEHYSTQGARAVYLLIQSETLRQRVFAALTSDAEQSYNTRIIAACLVGATLGNWPRAFQLLAPLREDKMLNKKQQTQCAALEMMPELGSWNKREGAAKAKTLAKWGAPITPLLLYAAHSPQPRFRRDIITALAILADARAVGLLIQALADTDTKVRRTAISGLVRMGKPAVAPLIEALASDQTKVRRYALLCLGHINAQRAKPYILQALEDAEVVVRRQAIRSLKPMVTVDDIPQLKQFLRVADWENAREATEALGNLGHVTLDTLTDIALGEHTPGAAYYIASQGDERGREILISQLDAEDPQVQTSAVELLRELQDPHCIPYLEAKLRETNDWRGAFLARELGRIGGMGAIAILTETLKRTGTEEAKIRRGAVRGLSEIHSPEVILPLIQCFNDEDSKVIRYASKALARSGERVAKPLKSALEAEEIQGQHAREAARAILRDFGEHLDER